ncbi:hypothetical protein YC2023_088065 [Brassica napus]
MKTPETKSPFRSPPHHTISTGKHSFNRPLRIPQQLKPFLQLFNHPVLWCDWCFHLYYHYFVWHLVVVSQVGIQGIDCSRLSW